MSGLVSDDLQAAIDDACQRRDIQALEALIPRARYEGRAALAALADGYAMCVSELWMDVECGKLTDGAGTPLTLSQVLPEVIDGFATCRQLCPEDPEYAIYEARVRLDLASEDDGAAAADEAGRALDLMDQLLAGWTAPDTGAPTYTLEGNIVRPRASGREDVHNQRARALFIQARCGAASGSRAAEACAAARASIGIQADDKALSTWYHGAGRLSASDDPGVRAAGDQAMREFDSFAVSWTEAHPADARWWGKLFTHLSEHGGGPAALARAAVIWRDYAVHPALGPHEATEIGHLIHRCGRSLGDRGLLENALSFHEDALERSPDNFQSGYVANVCRDLARLPGTPPDVQLVWYNRAVSACRRHEMPEDDFHFGVHFAGLLLDRASRFAFPPGHPDIEEAWRRSDILIASHGHAYLVQSEHAAWARLLQGRDAEAATILRDALARLAHPVAPEHFCRCPWFAALAPERAIRLRSLIGA